MPWWNIWVNCQPVLWTLVFRIQDGGKSWNLESWSSELTSYCHHGNLTWGHYLTLWNIPLQRTSLYICFSMLKELFLGSVGDSNNGFKDNFYYVVIVLTFVHFHWCVGDKGLVTPNNRWEWSVSCRSAVTNHKLHYERLAWIMGNLGIVATVIKMAYHISH